MSESEKQNKQKTEKEEKEYTFEQYEKQFGSQILLQGFLSMYDRIRYKCFSLFILIKDRYRAEFGEDETTVLEEIDEENKLPKVDTAQSIIYYYNEANEFRKDTIKKSLTKSQISKYINSTSLPSAEVYDNLITAAGLIIFLNHYRLGANVNEYLEDVIAALLSYINQADFDNPEMRTLLFTIYNVFMAIQTKKAENLLDALKNLNTVLEDFLQKAKETPPTYKDKIELNRLNKRISSILTPQPFKITRNEKSVQNIPNKICEKIFDDYPDIFGDEDIKHIENTIVDIIIRNNGGLNNEQ